jgi:hypothetical protein
MFGPMNELKIRLSPESGMTAVWRWEITLKGKKVAGGTSSGSQEFAYTTAHEALLNYPPRAAAPDLVKNPSLSGGQGPCQIVTMTISASVVREAIRRLVELGLKVKGK